MMEGTKEFFYQLKGIFNNVKGIFLCEGKFKIWPEEFYLCALKATNFGFTYYYRVIFIWVIKTDIDRYSRYIGRSKQIPYLRPVIPYYLDCLTQPAIKEAKEMSIENEDNGKRSIASYKYKRCASP
jgi:hypothetical protein